MRSLSPLACLLLVLVVAVLALQVIHLFIFSCLEMKKMGKLRTFEKETKQQQRKEYPISYFRVDTGGSYQIYHSVVDKTKNKLLPQESVTMVTHCSSHNLHYLPDLVDRWKGPISLAVFTTTEDFQVSLRAIHSYSNCFPELQRLVQFHVVLPIESMVQIRSLNFTHRTNVPCENLNLYIKKHIKRQNYALTGVAYPNNLLRNVGRLAARTKFVLTVDIDLLPNSGLYSQTLQFLKLESATQSHKTTAYVLPVFELEESNPVPNDKDELMTALNEGSARQFYTELCHRCHSPTDYESWIETRVS